MTTAARPASHGTYPLPPQARVCFCGRGAKLSRWAVGPRAVARRRSPGRFVRELGDRGADGDVAKETIHSASDLGDPGGDQCLAHLRSDTKGGWRASGSWAWFRCRSAHTQHLAGSISSRPPGYVRTRGVGSRASPTRTSNTWWLAPRRTTADLCAADLATGRRFSTDPLNLTLAGPRVNRYEKVDRDAAEWLPVQNRCWFAARVIAVRQRYGLTSDRREADALDQVLAGCASTELITFARGEVPAAVPPSVRVPEVIAAWDDNRNGRVSCAEAQAHGIAPVTRDHPAYPFMRDGDGDGVVCESGSRRASPASPPASPRASGAGCGPYRNCTALRRDHPNGVLRGHRAYQRRMDRDNDGRACER